MQGQLTTTDSLINAAIRVLSARPSASLSEIAESAGVKRVTLHRLIGTREDLLQEIALRSLADMDKAATFAAKSEKSAINKLRAIVAALVPIADRCHFLWQHPSIWESETLAREIAKHDKDMCRLVDAAKEAGDIPADIPNAWITASMDAVIYAALTASRSGDIAVNDAAELATRTFFEGIQKHRPQARKRTR